MALNRVLLVGRLTRDPELRYTPAGVPVAQFGLAVQRVTKDESGDYGVDFFNIVAWRRTAEYVSNYLTKGRLVSVDGRLQARSWVDQSGQKRTAIEIVAENVDGLERRPDAEHGASAEGDPDHPAVEHDENAPPRTERKPRPATPSSSSSDQEDDPFADE